MKIIVADDCTLTKEGIKSLLKPEADMNVVAEAEDGEKAVRLVKELKPDVLLLNVKLPRANGLEVIRRARGLCKVIIIAAGDDGEKFIQAGAWDCLPRNMAGGDLAAALYKAKDEKAPPRPEAAGKKPLLTAREIEVIQLIGQGMSNKAIANELYLSEKTVKNHLTNIFKKLKVADRTQALLYALKNRLVSL